MEQSVELRGDNPNGEDFFNFIAIEWVILSEKYIEIFSARLPISMATNKDGCQI